MHTIDSPTSEQLCNLVVYFSSLWLKSYTSTLFWYNSNLVSMMN